MRRETFAMAMFLLICSRFSVEGLYEFQITTDPDDQYDPAIYGDIVVWTETDKYILYSYDLSTSKKG